MGLCLPRCYLVWCRFLHWTKLSCILLRRSIFFSSLKWEPGLLKRSSVPRSTSAAAITTAGDFWSLSATAAAAAIPATACNTPTATACDSKWLWFFPKAITCQVNLLSDKQHSICGFSCVSQVGSFWQLTTHFARFVSGAWF